MISISTFKNIDISEKILAYPIEFEFAGLVNPIYYTSEFLKKTRELVYFDRIRSAHGPFYDLIPGSLDEEVAKLAWRKFKRAIDACSALGIRKLILHSGWIKEFYTEDQWISNSVKFWKSLLAECPLQLTICLENVLEDSPFMIKRIVTEVDAPNFRICLDIGHVNIQSDLPIAEWISHFGKLIEHVHIHNNHGEKDEHNGLINGNIDMASVLNQLRSAQSETASWNMEIRNGIEESIEWAVKYKEGVSNI